MRRSASWLEAKASPEHCLSAAANISLLHCHNDSCHGHLLTACLPLIDKLERVLHILLESFGAGFAALASLVLDHEVQLKQGTQVAQIRPLVRPREIIIVCFLKNIRDQGNAGFVLGLSGKADGVQAILHQQKLAHAHVSDGVHVKFMVDGRFDLLPQQHYHFRNGFHSRRRLYP